MTELTAFFATPTGALVYGVLAATFADLVFGVWAAVQSKSFDLSELAAFARTHLVGRVLPIFGLLFFGWAGNQPLLTAAGLTTGAAYIAETFGSVLDSWKAAGVKTQPVPTE